MPRLIVAQFGLEKYRFRVDPARGLRSGAEGFHCIAAVEAREGLGAATLEPFVVSVPNHAAASLPFVVSLSNHDAASLPFVVSLSNHALVSCRSS